MIKPKYIPYSSRTQALRELDAARTTLQRWFLDEGGRGVELADALDHVQAAIDILAGEEPELKASSLPLHAV